MVGTTKRIYLLFVGLIFMSNSALSQTILNSLPSLDNTLTIDADGVDVVVATLIKINMVNGVSLQNDFRFLQRISLVESNFGAMTSQNPNGGIWQITPYILSSLRSTIPASVQSLVAAFSQAFGSNAVDFTKDDYRVPLHSAVAARIFIKIQLSNNNDSFPGSVHDQANWWASNYINLTENSTTFVNRVQTYEAINQCSDLSMDLWFLIDGSASVELDNFQTCLQFVNQSASIFDISPNTVRTGLMVFDHLTYNESFFNQHQSNDEFSNVVLSTSYPKGGTQTGAAINETARIGFNEANGARPRSKGIPRVLVVLTDGQSFDSVVEASENIKSKGVIVFGVGVGPAFNKAEINEIASDPDSIYAFSLSEFSQLSSVLQQNLADQACLVSVVIQVGTNTSFVSQPGRISYLQISLPDSGFLELNFNVQATNSVLILYVSVTIPNPRPALYDATVQMSGGVTVVRYNVDQQRTKRQTDSGNRPFILYLGLETRGAEPLSIGLMANNRVDPSKATTTTTTNTANTTTVSEASKFEPMKGIGKISLLLLNILMFFCISYIF